VVKTCKTHRDDEKFIHSLSPKHVKERDHLKDLTVDGRILILKNLGMRMLTGFILFRQDALADCCDRDDEPPISIKDG
jgi:hypothetical protein